MHLYSTTCGQMAGGLCIITYVAQPAAYDPHPIIYMVIWKTLRPFESLTLNWLFGKCSHVISLGQVTALVRGRPLGKPESCTTSSDTTTTILANSSLAQTSISIKWPPQPCTSVQNGCASNKHQPRVLHRRISTMETPLQSRA